MGVDELLRLKQRPAGVALVPLGGRIPTAGTSTHDETVRQKALATVAEGALLLPGDDVAVLVHLAVDLPDELLVNLGFGGGVVVDGYLEFFQDLGDLPVDAACELFGRKPLAIGLVLDLGAVGIRARDVQHLIPHEAPEPGEHIPGKEAPHQVSQVEHPGAVWPGTAHKDTPYAFLQNLPPNG